MKVIPASLEPGAWSSRRKCIFSSLISDTSEPARHLATALLPQSEGKTGTTRPLGNIPPKLGQIQTGCVGKSAAALPDKSDVSRSPQELEGWLAS